MVRPSFFPFENEETEIISYPLTALVNDIVLGMTVSSSVFSDFGFMFQQDDSLNGLAIRMQLGLQLDNRVGFDN